jgi:tripartite-type tricarboxylate transporter receptor subunit TctC
MRPAVSVFPCSRGNVMNHPGRKLLHLAAGAAAFACLIGLAAPAAWSQTARTIKLIAPTPPGGSTDILARAMADAIGRAQGVTMVVENRSGGGEFIGIEAAARSEPDGNTLLVTANTFLISAQLRKANFHPVTSFEQVCLLVEAPTVLAVSSESPYRTLADLFDAARAKPGALSMASVGPGSAFHIGFATLTRTANVNMTFVPYAGMAPAVTAALGQHVTSIMATNSILAEHIRAGRLRGLAVAAPKRIAALPDVPTFAETGFKELEIDNWFGVVAPAKTPKPALTQLGDWFSTALRTPEVNDKLRAQRLNPVGTCGDDFAALVRKQYDDYGRIIREANFKIE